MGRKKTLREKKNLAESQVIGTVVLQKRSVFERLLPYFLLSIFTITIYFNTSKNEYALDDFMMITENSITQKGFDGVKEHFAHSFLYGYLNREGTDASSSHWRPLVMASFAMDIGFWGNDPHPG